jgi:TPR repeat protein
VRATPDILRFAPQPGDPDSCRRTAQPPDDGPENALQSRWLTLLERAAETGSGAAAYAAAEMHRRGEGCRPDPEAWEDWLWKAAGEHSPEPSPSACYLLGRSCLETPKQIQIGFETETGLMLLQRAVALGCPELDEAGLAALREQYAPHHDPA